MIHIDDDLTRHGEQDWRGQCDRPKKATEADLDALQADRERWANTEVLAPAEACTEIGANQMNTSNWTGRTHRTMEGAFGPYTDRRLEPEEDYRPPMSDGDRLMLGIVLAISAMASLAVLAWLIKALA